MMPRSPAASSLARTAEATSASGTSICSLASRSLSFTVPAKCVLALGQSPGAGAACGNMDQVPPDCCTVGRADPPTNVKSQIDSSLVMIDAMHRRHLAHEVGTSLQHCFFVLQPWAFDSNQQTRD